MNAKDFNSLLRQSDATYKLYEKGLPMWAAREMARYKNVQTAIKKTQDTCLVWLIAKRMEIPMEDFHLTVLEKLLPENRLAKSIIKRQKRYISHPTYANKTRVDSVSLIGSALFFAHDDIAGREQAFYNHACLYSGAQVGDVKEFKKYFFQKNRKEDVHRIHLARFEQLSELVARYGDGSETAVLKTHILKAI